MIVGALVLVELTARTFRDGRRDGLNREVLRA
jgi:hypothetical protein